MRFIPFWAAHGGKEDPLFYSQISAAVTRLSITSPHSFRFTALLPGFPLLSLPLGNFNRRGENYFFRDKFHSSKNSKLFYLRYKIKKMKQLVLAIGGLYGMTSVILGAFGAHAFKKILPADKLASFETGVKYQMYHALLLIIIGLFLQFQTTMEKSAAWSIISGTFIFSVSIYFLAFADHWGVNLKWLGPITPLGGLLMIVGWTLLIFYFVKRN